MKQSNMMRCHTSSCAWSRAWSRGARSRGGPPPPPTLPASRMDAHPSLQDACSHLSASAWSRSSQLLLVLLSQPGAARTSSPDKTSRLLAGLARDETLDFLIGGFGRLLSNSYASQNTYLPSSMVALDCEQARSPCPSCKPTPDEPPSAPLVTPPSAPLVTPPTAPLVTPPSAPLVTPPSAPLVFTLSTDPSGPLSSFPPGGSWCCFSGSF